MELVQEYLYNQGFIRTDGISPETFYDLVLSGWKVPLQSENNSKFKIYTQTMKVNGQWFRVYLRFVIQDGGRYKLNHPVPFVVVLCEPADEKSSEIKFRDLKVYHGRELNTTRAMIDAGVPVDLIRTVTNELNNHISYVQEEEG